MRRRAVVTFVAAVVLGAFATPAAARDRVAEIASDGPGPDPYDRVFVHQMGPQEAERVLVLMPGTMGGAGRLHAARPRARQAGRRPAGVGDRPPQPGAGGHRGVRAGARAASARCRRRSTTTSAGSPTAARRPTTTTSSTRARPFAREWGMKTALNDARKVVREAAAAAVAR